MMRKILNIIVLIITNASIGQNVDTRGLDVTMRGYLFLSKDGLFFQPLEYGQEKDFMTSLNKLSFKIEESTEIKYTEALTGVGSKLLVKDYFEDTIRKNPKLDICDTISYFKCDIYITMNFFDTSYTSFNLIGYGFIVDNNLINYGHLSIRNQLYKIIPVELKVLEQFYNSCRKKKINPPEWLEELYTQRKAKKTF